MRNARYIKAVFPILLVCGVYSVFADNAVWPPLLSVPQADTSHHADSNRVTVGGCQTYFDKVVKSKDTIVLHKNTPACGVDQLVNYEYNTDFTSHTNDHYFDLSGQVTKKNLPYGITAGLEWTPVLIVRKREKTSAVDATIESGPVLQFSAFGIPMKAHAGGAARMWNDSLVGGVHLA